MTIHTPAERIGLYWYLVRIPQIFLITEQELAHKGIVSSGNARMDRDAILGEVDAQLRICDMAEILEEGGSFTITEPQKSVEIYNTIVEVLNDWRHTVERTIVGDVPLDELRKLDALAVEVYKTARIFIKTSDTVGFFNTANLFKNRPLPGKALQDKPERKVAEEHKSIYDSINAELITQGIPWK